MCANKMRLGTKGKKKDATQAKKKIADRIDLDDPRVKKLIGAALGAAEELDSDLVEQLVKSVEKKTGKKSTTNIVPFQRSPTPCRIMAINSQS